MSIMIPTKIPYTYVLKGNNRIYIFFSELSLLLPLLTSEKLKK